MAESLANILESEASLITEAAEALPHQFSSCTYSLGHIRQAVYLCLTCAVPRGICSSCSIACHTKHEQVELFPKRAFRCDCPTSALEECGTRCTLRKGPTEETNEKNVYGQNFKGVFCRCGRPYDAKTERESMIQCLACEDWYHESCLNLRERPSSRAPTPTPQTAAEQADDASDASSSGLPPPLLTDEAYETLVCRSCVVSNPTLRKWAGTKGVLMVVRESPEDKWMILDDDALVSSESELNALTQETESQSGEKRPLSADANGSDASELESRAKRRRVDIDSDARPARSSSVCLAPPLQPTAQRILDLVSSDQPSYSLGGGDIFLTEGWRKRWCGCDNCMKHLLPHKYLLEEEETYEPPEDPDSTFSLEELGMRALQQLPRDRAIDGIRAYNQMRDELMEYLRPFAQQGHVVNEADVHRFFEERQEALRAKREAAAYD